MRLFKSVNVDWIGKKWIFIGASFALFLASVFHLIIKGGPRYGIDFRGGTLVRVKFLNVPQLDSIRAALKKEGLGESTIQRFDQPSEHKVIISLDRKTTEASGDIDEGRTIIDQTLNLAFRPPEAKLGKLDLNNVREDVLQAALPGPSLQGLAKTIIEYKISHSGLIKNFDDLSAVPGVTASTLSLLKEKFYLGEFSVIGTEIVGAKVGADLQRQAISATLYALGGMLLYIAWRFKGTIYGAAAVLAVFHDVIITLGFFSFFDKEISLTVIAALLTLVGYSMNDTIVVFDRIRENLKLSRRESLSSIINKSINQTLSRTVLTSGLTFVTVVSLYLFGGEVINGFAFAMVIGIVIGTYSSIAIASPLLVIWIDYRAKKKTLAKAS